MRRILIGTASAIALIAGSALAAETTSPFSNGSPSGALSPGVPASRGAAGDMTCSPGSTDPACRIVSPPGVGSTGSSTMGSGSSTLDSPSGLDSRYGIGGSNTGPFSGSSGLGSSSPGGRSDSSTGGGSGSGSSGGATSGGGGSGGGGSGGGGSR